MMRENVDYPELIWEDFAFQIDHKQLKKGKRENMPYPRCSTNTPLVKFLPRRAEAKSDPELARKQTASRRVVKKKFTITADDNIIPEPDVALELGKSISLTEAAKEEAARQVHATHARIVTKSIPKPARRKPSCIAFRDTSSVSKRKSSDPSQKLKGIQTLTPEEQIVTDTMKELKESKKTSKRQPGTRGSSEGTGVSPGVLDESTVIHATSSEGTGTKPGVPDEEKATSEDNVDTDEEEEKKEEDDNKSINLEQTNDEETNDEFVHGKEHVQDDEEMDDEFVHGDEQVNDNEDEEMTNVEVKESRNGDEEIFDAAKDTTDVEINSLLDIKIQYEVPHIQSPSVLTVHVSVIYEPSVLTPIPKTPSMAPTTTLIPLPSISAIPPIILQTTTLIPTPPITIEAPSITTAVLESDALTAVQLRVAKLEKDVS
ncbi:hypothetical protein Tco_1469798, partial [Tanacetum coccineum]